MFDHVGIVVQDLKRSASLYAHRLAPLGFKLLERSTEPIRGIAEAGCHLPTS